jgi:hypothetical protein
MVLGRADLAFKVFFLRSDNNFEAGFSGFKANRLVGGFFARFAGAEKLSTLTPFEMPDLKLFSDFRKKISWQKPVLPCNFSLGQKGAWWVFEKF